MRCLITGASGFVGHHLIEHLKAQGDEIVACVFPHPADQTSVETVELDVADGVACAKIISHYKPEVIYHLAAMAFVPEAEDSFEKTLRVNVLGTNNILRVAHLLQNNISVLLVSSAEVYGRILPKELPLTEETEVRPANNYSLSKAMAELAVARYTRAGFVRAVTVRPFNHIGPGQNQRFVASSFAHQLAMIAKKKAPPIIRVGNLEAKRDFSDVRDIVKAYRLAVTKGSGIYNLGAGKAVSVQYLLDTLIDIAKLDVRVEQDPARMRPAEVPVIYGDCSKARSELGWEATRDISETLKDVYHYWLDRI
ncbi:MAG: GDP-mannose 4,6-dehydratase [Bdellovibrionales bacterium]|nr:GDP-mannose 4,6-dehydratase [Bdellovibrionales bacterium]